MTTDKPSAGELLELANEYETGTAKAIATGYEEYGPEFQRKRELIIDALRSAALRSPVAMRGNVEQWIDREFTGHGLAVRTKSEPPIPGEPLMSMAVAKDLTRRALRELTAPPVAGAEVGVLPKGATIVGPNTVNGLPQQGGSGELCPPWCDSEKQPFDTNAARVAIWFRSWQEACAFVASLPPPVAERGGGGAQGPTVPDGYALVPLLPTPRMVEVGCDNNPTLWNEGTPDSFAADVANDVYVSMVSAYAHPSTAPTPTPETGDGSETIGGGK